ncbi:MAG TPA: alginate lyase family protein, partial [Myxococcota bacterium]|nr:alginate lyase family protein [Myxococcota bacterium]
ATATAHAEPAASPAQEMPAAPSMATEASTSASESPPAGLWISPERLRTLPMEGPAWQALRTHARRSIEGPDLSDQDSPVNVRVLARALYAVRTGDAEAADSVRRALESVRGSERGAGMLPIARELMSYVIAADLVGLEPAARERFESWLRAMRTRIFEGRTIRSTHEDRPNNWGTHAGATRLAIAAYLGDEQEIARAAHVFRGWTGERGGWRDFEFGARGWQAELFRNHAVNPVDARKGGHSIDGVLPDDQRRGGHFRWPPPRENYVYEALQGAVAQAVLLERLGHPAWEWGDRALLRAFRWLHDEADFPAEGDDTWLPHLVNDAYGTTFPAPVPSRPGKAMGFSDWTHGSPPAGVESPEE